MSLTTDAYDAPPLDDGLAALVRSGGHPFILITVVDETTGRSELVTAGIESASLAPALREIADRLDESQS